MLYSERLLIDENMKGPFSSQSRPSPSISTFAAVVAAVTVVEVVFGSSSASGNSGTGSSGGGGSSSNNSCTSSSGLEVIVVVMDMMVVVVVVVAVSGSSGSGGFSASNTRDLFEQFYERLKGGKGWQVIKWVIKLGYYLHSSQENNYVSYIHR